MTDIQQQAQGYFTRLQRRISDIRLDQIETAVQTLTLVRQNGGTVFVAGNGGSAATANHWASDLMQTQPSVSLCANTSVITCIANDHGYDDIFRRQLQKLSKPHDLFMPISASGNSRNVLLASQWCRDNDIQVLALTGFDGGHLKDIADFNLHVPTDIGDYGVAEDLHLIMDHLITSILQRQ